MKAPSIEAACDACAGVGDDPDCMCGGSGLATDAVAYLRDQLLKRPKRAEVRCNNDGDFGTPSTYHLAIVDICLIEEGDICHADYRFNIGPERKNAKGDRLWTRERLELAARLVNGWPR